MRGFLESWYRNPMFGAVVTDWRAREAMVADRLSGSPTALARALEGLSTAHQLPVGERLREAGVPTLFVAGRGGLPEPEWVGSLFHPGELAAADRASLLAGRPGPGRRCAGRTICACFNVGIETIATAIENDGLVSVDGIGRALKAGTNCGSCLPELRALLAARGEAAA